MRFAYSRMLIVTMARLQPQISETGVRFELGSCGRPYEHDPIRRAYVSETFRDHPVELLTACFIGCHNRDRFEVIAFSCGRLTPDATRARLGRSFDRVFSLPDSNNAAMSNLRGLCER